ncbi:hypothetical protein ACPOM7_17340 [Peribacillus castrilensis]|uniref:hypothetical protein n=1 Tax=Bacillaceae TaxID=186817 RepID=UPI000660BB03|nr:MULTISPECIES: hypothetical protein [Bacillaceae]MCT1390101.1 hypothetical protein [Peribacillus frigoritolerans]NCT40014.1 hypothetical protein [Peribacillus frigoritolerans]PRA73820.1 hypothetical protein CQ056_27955 [Peribacillus simplex]
MRKYSRLDLINNGVIDHAGSLIHRLFESKHARLNIKVPLYDLKRAQVFVGTINEIIEDEVDNIFTLEELIYMFYLDFLRQIDRGMNLDTLAKWIRSIQKDEIDSDLEINHYLQEKKELNIEDLKQHFKKRNTKKEEYTYISVKIEKQHVLRGEVLLHDLHELYPDLHLDVEEFLTLRFKDIMSQIKSGDYQILRNIVELLTN